MSRSRSSAPPTARRLLRCRFRHRCRRHHAPRRGGFTLVELMVVMGIILILVSILVPVVGRARQSSKATSCLANLRSLGTAFVGYVNTNRHAPIYQDQGIGPGSTLEKLTWEGALAANMTNRNARVCPEAMESAATLYGGSAQGYYGASNVSYGDPALTIPPNSSDPSTAISYGSYGFNGFLYYLDPNQLDANGKYNPTWGGAKYAGLTPPGSPNQPQFGAQVAILNYFFFPDPLTAGGAVPDSSLLNRASSLPATFGDAGSIPVFGDCNAVDAWPRNDAKQPKPPPTGFPAQQNDPIPTGANASTTGDRGGIGHMLGRFYLDRHRKAINIVFLDGHAAPVPLSDLQKLRWNKWADPTNP